MALVRQSGIPETLKKLYDVDANGNILYEGWAHVGALTSEASWCIKKYTYTGGYLTMEQLADGNNNQDNVWDDRVGLTYA